MSPRVIDPDAKHDAVLDAALDLLGERTYGATAMPEVADRAGVAVGTVYRFFPSKEALVNAVYRRWKGRFAAALAEAVGDPTGLSPRAEFDRWWDGLTAFAAAHPAAFSFLETHRHDQYLDEESRALAAAVDDEAAAFVRRAQRAGAMRRGRPDAMVAMVFGAFVGLHKLVESTGAPLSRPEQARARDAAWALVAAPT